MKKDRTFNISAEPYINGLQDLGHSTVF